MQNLTFGQVAGALAFLVAFISSLEFLFIRFRKWLIYAIKSAMKTELKELQKDIKELQKSATEETLSRCKYDLISIMSRIQNGYDPTEEEKRILIETKDIYNGLGGDGYIDNMFDNLKKEGLL